MNLYIKVCGLCTPQAIEAAVLSGADAIGFVFAPSVREVAPAVAAQLARGVPGHVDVIAVTRHPSQTLIDDIVQQLSPRWLQTDAEDLAQLSLPAGLQVLPVLRSGTALPAVLPPRYLYEGATSGVGRTADWVEAARLATGGGMILAGGLNAQNVERAIAAVRPLGIDVSSGVESAPGRKDPELIETFISRARAVARTLSGVEA